MKYEEVYLHAYDSVSVAREGIGRYLDLYNAKRPHQSLDRRTPDVAYFTPHANPSGGVTTGGNPLNDSPELFKQTEPPLLSRR